MNKNDDKKPPVENRDAESLLKELGVVNLPAGFESDIQYINIIGSIEGHMLLPQENKTTKYEHLIRTNGMVITSETAFAYLRKTQERVIDFIEKHSGADRDAVVKMINRTDDMPNDIGTILFGQEAVDLGIIDEVGGLSQALKKLKSKIRDNELTKNGK